MPGEESGAGRIKAPDLYRVKGSLPIRNDTTQGVAGSIGSVASRDWLVDPHWGFEKRGFEN
jgi:hypothetical protein